MKSIGVGVIGASPGAGWAAATHVPALQALPQYDLRAVATSRTESARRSATVDRSPRRRPRAGRGPGRKGD